MGVSNKTKSLFQDNLILFISTSVLNLFGFLFHFYMGRTLGPAVYGTLGALLSLIYIANIPLNTIQTSMAKFVTKFVNAKEFGKINYLLTKSLKRLTLVGIITMIGFIIFIPFIADFLRITNDSLYLLSFFILFLLLTSVVRGILQGLQKFKSLGGTLVIEGIMKFSLGVLFVSIGWGVNGAITAIIFSYVAAFLIGGAPLKKYFSKTKNKFDTKQIYSYSGPLILMLTALTLFYSIDLILVKHFFDEHTSGLYAAMSLIGKVLFFGSLSISQVMFPKVSELYANNKPTKHILFKSMGIISLLIIPGILFYLLFPDFLVRLFFGDSYLEISSLIWIYGTFIGVFSYSYLLSFYQISLHRRKFIITLFVFVLLETILITIYHDTILQIVQTLLILSVILLLVLLAQVLRK